MILIGVKDAAHRQDALARLRGTHDIKGDTVAVIFSRVTRSMVQVTISTTAARAEGDSETPLT
jgi:hypothetical protein